MPRQRPIHNPSLPDTGPVTVDLGSNFNPMPDKPPVLVYGSSTPQARAFHEAEAQRGMALPAPQKPPQITAGSGDDDVRSPSVAYVDDFEDGDGNKALRRTEDRAKQRLQERLRQSEQATAEALKWGQQQAGVAAAAAHAVVESQHDTVATALASAEREAEAAEEAMIAAKTRGDVAAEVKAQRMLMQAEQRIGTLRAGKDELEVQVRTKPQPAAPPPALNRNVEAVLARLDQLTDSERDWIRKHPESIMDPNNQQAMQVAFRDAQKKGLERGSREYFEFFEDRLGFEPDPGDDGDDGDDGYEEPPVRQQQRQVRPAAPAQRRVAAPVSRADSSGGGVVSGNRVQLSPQQREFARISGVSEAEYARGVARLVSEKNAGLYGDRPMK